MRRAPIRPAPASLGPGRRVLARGHPVLRPRVRGQARRAAAHPHGRRDRRHPPPDSLRDRSLRVRQYRHDGGGALQPQSYVTGRSTNMDGACSPAADVHYEEDAERNLTTRLGPFIIDRFACGESAGYPTICKGRYRCRARDADYYAFEEPYSLNLSALLPDLMQAGVTALKIEGRQRSRAYVQLGRLGVPHGRGRYPGRPRARVCEPDGVERSAAAKPKARSPPRRGDRRCRQTSAVLTLGPVLFNWRARAVARFLFPHRRRGGGRRRSISARSCASKRAPLIEPISLTQVVERLEAGAGKTVVLRDARASRAAKHDRQLVERVCAAEDSAGGGQRRLRSAAFARPSASRRALRECL